MSKYRNKSRLLRKYKWWLRDKSVLHAKWVRILLMLFVLSVFLGIFAGAAAVIYKILPSFNGTVSVTEKTKEASQATEAVTTVEERSEPEETLENPPETETTEETETEELTTEEATETEELTTETALEPADDTPGYYLFIGDSRTEMLDEYHLGDSSRDIFISKVGACFEWFRDEAVPEARKVLQEKKIHKVFINMGVNDACYAYNHSEEHPERKYANAINALMEEFPDVKFYFYSVGYGAGVKYGNIVMDEMNAYLDTYNALMEELCRASYIPLCEYLKATGYVCTDNLHYNYDTCKKIYEFVVGYSIDSSIFVR